MRVFSAGETRSLLPFSALADAIAEVLATSRAGGVHAPERLVLPAGSGQLLVMPASDDLLAVTKLVTAHPDNLSIGRPVIQGEMVVMDAATGRRLGLFDGQIVTARRTAALSLLAARHLAPEPGGDLLVVGAGVQGRAHMEAFVEGLGVRRVYIASRTDHHAELLADFGRSLGIDAAAVQRDEDVLSEVSLVVTATSSLDPVFKDRLADQAFVAAVGSHTPRMAELPSKLVLRARVYADTIEGVAEQGGCLLRAGVDMSSVIALEDALDQPRPESGPVVFKSVGHAVFDLAAAHVAMNGREGRP